MSKSRTISTIAAGLIIVVYLFMAVVYRAILWPVTGVNGFHFDGVDYHDPEPSEFSQHTMCRIGPVSAGLGWLLGTVYEKPYLKNEKTLTDDKYLDEIICYAIDSPSELYVKRGNSIKKFIPAGKPEWKHSVNGHAEHF